MTTLFTLEGPICAIDLGGTVRATICRVCGRGRTERVRPPDVELVCDPRIIWATDAGSILVDVGVIARLESVVTGITFAHATCAWRHEAAVKRPTPHLYQIGSKLPVRASAESVEREDCTCGAIRRISLEPLIVQLPDPPASDSIWYLQENPEILILGDAVKQELLSLAADLEFADVYREGSYEQPTRTFDGEDWSDL